MEYRTIVAYYDPEYSEISIQRRFLWMWWNIDVHPVYTKNLEEALRYIKLKRRGFKVDKIYYE